MLRSLYVTLIYLAFLALGTSAPFVFSLGYVWVDTTTPQAVAYEILPLIPVSLIMAIAAVAGYFIADRRAPPRPGIIMLLTLLFAVWVTLTTAFWAVVPSAAWQQWDIAIKTILFSAFLQLVFRSRVQIESFLQIYVFSLALQFVPYGLKTIVHGGAYGVNLGVLSGNSGLAEGSTLATVSVMVVPIILYLRTHTVILQKSRLLDAMYITLVVTALAAAIGTFERTGLVAMVVMGAGLWLRAKHKVLTAIVGIAAVVIIALSVSHGWTERIDTIQTYRDNVSALSRILVWKWTLGFVGSHPLGGGFGASIIDHYVIPAALNNGVEVVGHGKAFHSIYFQVLGTQGWAGLGMFLGLIAASFAALQGAARRAKRIEGMAWCRDLAFALQVVLMTLIVGGAFIGIAFQPMLYYLFALSACLRHHVRCAERLAVRPGEAARYARSRAPGRAQLPAT